ncbi:helicase [Burkholderia anthina]|uniref:helicase n=1 Tax=Burkholderia anthina TaxID=179879 RepID=UPI001588605F|nr:helicase [Burkholderia anthina]
MVKFKFLLWALTKLMQRAIKNNSACAEYVEGKDLIFQIRTISGVGRYFTIKNSRVSSVSGISTNPKFTMTFRDAARGFSILSAKNGKDAFLSALHRKDLVVSGDFVELMWFQGFTEYLQPVKKGGRVD